MLIDGHPTRTIWPTGGGAVEIIDQTRLPHDLADDAHGVVEADIDIRGGTVALSDHVAARIAQTRSTAGRAAIHAEKPSFARHGIPASPAPSRQRRVPSFLTSRPPRQEVYVPLRIKTSGLYHLRRFWFVFEVWPVDLRAFEQR